MLFDHGYFDDPDIMVLIGVFLSVFAVIGFFMLIFWIFRSLGLYRLAKNRGMSGAGLAWIPFIGSYRIGSIADDIAEKSGSKSPFRIILLVGYIISFLTSGFSYVPMVAGFSRYGMDSPHAATGMLAASGISSLLSLIGLALYVIQVIALNKIYKAYRPASSTTYTVLSAIPFTVFMQSIFLFIIRGDEPVQQYGGQAGYYPPQYAPPPYNPGQPPYYPQGYQPQPPQHQPQPPQYQPPPPPPEYMPPPRQENPPNGQ